MSVLMTLNRTTPMPRGTGLRPVSPVRLAEMTEQGIRPFTTFAAPQKAKNRGAAKPLARRADTGPDKATVDLVLERDLHSCVSCGRGVGAGRGVFWSVQHRVARGPGNSRRPGVNSPAALVITCGSASTLCHARIEERREADRVQGFWVRQYLDGRPTNPSTVPLLHAAHGWVLLDHDGGYEHCTPHEEWSTCA